MAERSYASRAFLLFEVMVAVTIVGIGLATVLASIAFALGAARVAKDYFTASSLLSQKLWEITSVGSTQPGSTEGAFKDNSQYRYRVLVEELFAENPIGPQIDTNPQYRLTPQAAGLAKISIIVFWDSKGKARKILAETYLPILPEESRPPQVKYPP